MLISYVLVAAVQGIRRHEPAAEVAPDAPCLQAGAAPT
jgi:hypothetical protein